MGRGWSAFARAAPLREPTSARSLAWLSSAVLHGALLLLLALWALVPPQARETLWLDGGVARDLPGEFDLELVEGDRSEPATAAAGPPDLMVGGALSGVSAVGAPRLPGATAAAAAERVAPQLSLDGLANPLQRRGGGMAGRRGLNRRRLALGGGGTEASEDAVERGLRWLAQHQLPDGSWRFDLRECPNCQGACGDSGSYHSTTAATGMALLCFLGAGYTHMEGTYQETVAEGLYYLQERMTLTSRGGDLRDFRAGGAGGGLAPPRMVNPATSRFDTMYSHGIATLALTEAFAMTRDPGLREPAQQALNFIVGAQFADGGWRYLPSPDSPGPGDMTVSGWQITALKSGLLAGLEIPYDIWERIAGFLDTLQEDGGAGYRYVRGEQSTEATHAIGLLCRMIGGWPRDARPLVKGLARAAAQQPAESNMYFNFYAAQLLHHAGGPQWERWNPRMRDYLVDTQALAGHEAGSWYVSEAHSSVGGRLYTTALAIMTLEVYYRYLPLYGEQFIELAP